MLCDFCHKNEANIFLEQVGKNSKTKICLCTACADARGIDPSMSPENNKNIVALFEEFYAKKQASDPENKILCSVCGRSLAIIRKTGIAGCPECYSTFSQEIHEMLRNFGVQQNYTGMLPRRLASFRNTLTDRMDIQLKLEESVRNEDYEKAAVYRDFLHALEKSSVSDASDSCQTGEGL